MAAEPRRLVRSRVAFALRGLAAVRVLESALLGIATALLGASAALSSGARGGDRGAWIAAALCGVLVALTWALGHRRTAEQVARELDRRLGARGALFTAWEWEVGRAGRLGAALSERVASRHAARELLQRVLPPVAPVLALPFLAAGLLFLTLESRRVEPREADLAELTGSLERELRGLSGAQSGAGPEGAAELSSEERAELAAVARAAERVARELSAETPRPEEGSADLAELDQRLARLRERARPGSELDEVLRRAQETLETTRRALEPPAAPGDPGGGSGGQSAGEAGRESGGASDSEVASPAGDGTMSGFQLPPSLREDGAPAGGVRAPVGVAGGSTWPEAYDGIVTRWVEARRADSR